MSPTAAVACRIVSRIRERERKAVWTKDMGKGFAHSTDEILYQGMMFNLAKGRMENTDLWKIVQRMPKGKPSILALPPRYSKLILLSKVPCCTPIWTPCSISTSLSNKP